MYLVGKPNIPNKSLYLKRVEDILDSKVLSNDGKYTKLLEESVRNYLGVKHCIAVCNATIGLELAISSILGEGPGEIIIPSFTFIATAQAVKRCGFTPVFVDCLDKNFSLNYKKIKITENTKGIIAVNLFGSICDQAKLEKLGVPVIYDSAHALGVSDLKGTYVGNFGKAEVFSLHATKFINSGEGGLITTNDDAIALKIKKYKSFGYHPESGLKEGLVCDYGTNAKMSELSAALGLTNFEHIQEICNKNYENFLTYKENLPSWCHLKEPNTIFSNYSYIPVIVNKSIRDDLVNYLWNKGIKARTYFKAIHTLDPFRSFESLPVTESISNKIICLPQGIDLEKIDILYICDIINKFL